MLTACKDNGDHLPISESSGLSDPIGEIWCHKILLLWYQICILFEGQAIIYPRHNVYCSYMMHAYCTLWISSILISLNLYLYHFILVPWVGNKHIIYIYILIGQMGRSLESVMCACTRIEEKLALSQYHLYHFLPSNIHSYFQNSN